MDILSFWEILKSIIFLILNKQGPRGFTRNTSRSHPPLNFVNLSKRVVPPPLYPYLIEEAVVVYSSFCLLSCLSDVTIFVFLSFWRFFCLALSLFLNKSHSLSLLMMPTFVVYCGVWVMVVHITKALSFT